MEVIQPRQVHQCSEGGYARLLIQTGIDQGACGRERGLCHDQSPRRSEEHTSELKSLMRSSYAVFFLKKHEIRKETRVRNNTDTDIQHSRRTQIANKNKPQTHTQLYCAQ